MVLNNALIWDCALTGCYKLSCEKRALHYRAVLLKIEEWFEKSPGCRKKAIMAILGSDLTLA